MPEPNGSRSTAGSSRSPWRSSVTSQARGRGWRAAMALPIAAPMRDSSVQERLDVVRRQIGDAARLANRKSDEVTLIAVSKTHPVEAILPLIESGQRDFGENRVQEAAAKWPELKARYPDVRLHLVGQLQSNKAEEAVALFDVIHSVDRASLIEALARAADKAGRRPD